MKNIKRKIKNILPDHVVYFYSLLQSMPKYIKAVWIMRGEKHPPILFYDDKTTVDKIILEKKSLSRFGDGEFRWMLGIKRDSFQGYSDDLCKALKQAFQSSNPKLLIGFPYGIIDAGKCNLYAKMYWKSLQPDFYKKLLKFVDSSRTYCDASITRPYIDYRDKEYSKKCFENLRRIWEDREIVIVEGKQTKLGIGNDLFSNTKSIRRIICPAENAFEKIEEIKRRIAELVKPEEMILAALGPTATVLASEMCDLGYQVVDIGHVDVEYAWYLRHDILRKPIEGKYVNESGIKGCSDFYDHDPDYLQSIIAMVK